MTSAHRVIHGRMLAPFFFQNLSTTDMILLAKHL